MNGRFDQSDLDRLRSEDEIEIETWSVEPGPRHRTIIWVVVDDQNGLVRSYRGPSRVVRE